MARTSSSSKSQAPGTRNEKRGPKPRPIGKAANGKSTSGAKDKVDVAAEGSFPASDPPAAASASAPAPPPAQDISPAHYLDPQELAKRKPR